MSGSTRAKARTLWVFVQVITCFAALAATGSNASAMIGHTPRVRTATAVVQKNLISTSATEPLRAELNATPRPRLLGALRLVKLASTRTSVTLGWPAQTRAMRYTIFRGRRPIAHTRRHRRIVRRLRCGGTFRFGVQAVYHHHRSRIARLRTSTRACQARVLAPTITNLTATPGTTDATVAATVDSGGAPTVVTVQFGTSGLPEQQTTPQAVPTGGSITVGLPGLTPGATYQYEMSATNSAGTTTTATDFLTTTSLTSPGLGTVTATATATTASLSVPVTTGGSLTTLTLTYSASGGVPQLLTQTLSSPGSETIPLTGLASGTVYTYQLDASNSVGSAIPSAGSFTTLAIPAPVLSADAVASITQTAAILSVGVNTGGSDTAVTVTFGSTLADQQTITRTVTADGIASFTLGNLTAGTAYSYAITATNAGGGAGPLAGSFTTLAAVAGPPDLYVSPAGSDSNSCTQSAPCASFERAYQVASFGDVVSIEAGTYSYQLIDQYKKTPGAGWVTFVAQPGVVLSDELRLSSVSDLRFVNLNRFDDYVLNSSYVEFQGGSEHLFFVRSSDHVTYRDVSVGDQHDGASPTIGAAYQSPVPSTYVTLDNVTFHNIDRQANPTAHTQCLFLQESENVVIENSSFSGCEVMDLYMHKIGLGPNPTHVVVSNNVFGTLAYSGYYAVMTPAVAGETFDDVTFQGNTYGQQRAVVNTGGTVTNFHWCDGPSELSISGGGSTAGIFYTC